MKLEKNIGYTKVLLQEFDGRDLVKGKSKCLLVYDSNPTEMYDFIKAKISDLEAFEKGYTGYKELLGDSAAGFIKQCRREGKGWDETSVLLRQHMPIKKRGFVQKIAHMIRVAKSAERKSL